jgi:hypothetical protein
VNQKYKIIILYLITLPLLIGVRIYLLDNTGLFDYDSVKNFMVAKEISEGKFVNLFHHVSPTFNLFYGLFYKIFKNYLILEYLDSLFNVAAIFIFVHFLAQRLKLNLFQTGFMLLLSGMSLFMVNSSRYFGIESISLFLFVLIVINYFKNLEEGSDKYLYIAAFLYALLMTVNRKFVVFIFIVLAIELAQRNRKLIFKNILFCVCIMIGPFIAYPLIAFILGMPFLQYYASLYCMFFRIEGNPVHYSTFNFDIFYYLKFFFYYENPLLIITVFLFPFLYRKELFSNIREINIYNFLFIITGCFLAGMSILNKAPRGLLGIYLVLYFFLFICLNKVLRNKFALGLVGLTILLFDIYQIDKNIYRYSSTNYDEVARYMEKKQIKKLVTTVGINIIPFLKQDVEVKMIFDERELPGLKKEGFNYVLLDDFHYLADVNQFNDLHKLKPVFEIKEPSLLAPLMSLELSEYSSIGFYETLKLREKVENDKFQLRLIDLNQ